MTDGDRRPEQSCTPIARCACAVRRLLLAHQLCNDAGGFRSRPPEMRVELRLARPALSRQNRRRNRRHGGPERATLSPPEEGVPLSHAIRREPASARPSRGRRKRPIATKCTHLEAAKAKGDKVAAQQLKEIKAAQDAERRQTATCSRTQATAGASDRPLRRTLASEIRTPRTERMSIAQSPIRQLHSDAGRLGARQPPRLQTERQSHAAYSEKQNDNAP